MENTIINGLKKCGYFGLNVHQRINAKVSKYFMYCTCFAEDYNYRAYWRKAKWGFYLSDVEGITPQTLKDIRETINFYKRRRVEIGRNKEARQRQIAS
jgi:hypothetical protein